MTCPLCVETRHSNPNVKLFIDIFSRFIKTGVDNLLRAILARVEIFIFGMEERVYGDLVEKKILDELVAVFLHFMFIH